HPRSSPFFLFTAPLPPWSPPFPSTTLFRSVRRHLPPPEAGEHELAFGVEIRDPPGSSAEHAVVLPLRQRAAIRDHDLHRVAHVLDRKSTRLNSSHVKISYAVFCLKKKTRPM